MIILWFFGWSAAVAEAAQFSRLNARGDLRDRGLFKPESYDVIQNQNPQNNAADGSNRN